MLDIRQVLEFYLNFVLLGKASYPTVLRLLHGPAFRPLLDQPVSAVTPLDVARWHRSREGTPCQATRALKTLRAAYRWGQTMQLVEGNNPCEGVRPFPERDRDRVLTSEEWHRLAVVLDGLPPTLRVFLLVLRLTGARPSEIRLMRWTDLDVHNATWRNPRTKTGRSHVVPLPAQLVAEFSALGHQSPWVFPGVSPAVPWCSAGPRQAWTRWRKAAGLTDCWLYDFRRTAATDLREHGADLLTIRQLLNHQRLAYTQRYARVTSEALRAAVQAEADRLLPGQGTG